MTRWAWSSTLRGSTIHPLEAAMEPLYLLLLVLAAGVIGMQAMRPR